MGIVREAASDRQVDSPVDRLQQGCELFGVVLPIGIELNRSFISLLDRVRMPQDLLNLNELLPADQRYYQFMGSLTTPPCSENVLWMVMKQPVPISRAQIRLFTQLYPNNARPVQPLNGRTVRDAQ